MKKQNFKSKLLQHEKYPTSAYVIVNFDEDDINGNKGIIRTIGKIDGQDFKKALTPIGNGGFIMIINNEILNLIGKKPGDFVNIEMELDGDIRTVFIPEDFLLALNNNRNAQILFDKMPPSHKREYIRHIDEAKKPETRLKRIEKTIELLEKITN